MIHIDFASDYIYADGCPAELKTNWKAMRLRTDEKHLFSSSSFCRIPNALPMACMNVMIEKYPFFYSYRNGMFFNPYQYVSIRYPLSIECDKSGV